MLQIVQLRSLICNFGLAYLPRSMARVWELVLNCAIAILYLWFFSVFSYGAMPNELLILLYVLKRTFRGVHVVNPRTKTRNWKRAQRIQEGPKFCPECETRGPIIMIQCHMKTPNPWVLSWSIYPQTTRAQNLAEVCLYDNCNLSGLHHVSNARCSNT